LVLLILVLLSLLLSTLNKKYQWENYVLLILDKENTKYIVWLIFNIVFFLAYFIRPLLLEPDPPRYLEYFNYNSMVEFCWYTSFAAILFAIWGIASSIGKDNEHKQPLFLFISISLISTVIYLYKPSITPDHFWASRRWITVNIPFIMIFASVGIVSVIKIMENRYSKKISRVMGKIFVLIIVLFSFYQSSLFIFRTMLKDYTKQYQIVADSLDSNAVYLTNNPRIASPLKYIWQKPVYLLDTVNYNNFIEIQQTIGRKVYLIFDGSFWFTKTVNDFMISGDYPERIRNRYPKKTFQWSHKLVISELIDINSFQGSLDIPLKSMMYKSTGERELLIYGPYIQLPKGTFEIKFNFKIHESIEGAKTVFRVNAADKELAKQDVDLQAFRHDDIASVKLLFHLESKAVNIEFPIAIPDGVIIEIISLELSSVPTE
jgi:hypothetical protein